MKKLTIIIAIMLTVSAVFVSCSPQIVYPDETPTETSIEAPLQPISYYVSDAQAALVVKTVGCKKVVDPVLINENGNVMEFPELAGREKSYSYWQVELEIKEVLYGDFNEGETVTVIQSINFVFPRFVKSGGFFKLDEEMVIFLYSSGTINGKDCYYESYWVRAYVNEDGTVEKKLEFEDFKPTTLDDYRNLFKDEK